jgi:hypothetical protein
MALRFLVAAAAVTASLTGCHLRAGFDAASHTNGPLHTLMASSSTSSSGVTNLPQQGGNNYALEAGFGTSTLTVNGVLAMHDVTSTSFTEGSGYLATTFGANVRWNILDWHGLSPSIAGGPARMLLVDRSSGSTQWGNALRVSAGAQYKLGPIAIYGDLYREIVAFGDGAAQGNTTLDGFTVGLALTP